jgi:hypothetical protein
VPRRSDCSCRFVHDLKPLRAPMGLTTRAVARIVPDLLRGGAIVAVKVDLYSVLPLNSRSTARCKTLGAESLGVDQPRQQGLLVEQGACLCGQRSDRPASAVRPGDCRPATDEPRSPIRSSRYVAPASFFSPVTASMRSPSSCSELRPSATRRMSFSPAARWAGARARPRPPLCRGWS